MTGNTHQRIYGLDILRAFAILFVMVEHGRFFLPVELFPNQQFFFLKLHLDGVSVFFVLSGFLIGGILIKQFDKQIISPKGLQLFWARRWMRTLPNYFLILLLLLILHFIFVGSLPAAAWQYFLFVQNFWAAHPAFFREAWSLSVEEWFYLLLPVLLYALVQFGRLSFKRALFWSATIFVIIPFAIRLHSFYSIDVIDGYVWDDLFRKRVVTRMDSLMAGVLGAYLLYYAPGIFNRNKRLCFLLGILLLVGNKAWEIADRDAPGLYSSVMVFSVNALATLLLLPLLNALRSGKGVLFKLLTCCSLLSYSMYLINLSLVQYWIIPQFNLDGMFDTRTTYLLKYFLFWAFTISLSFLLYRYFERPIMNLRDKKRNSLKLADAG